MTNPAVDRVRTPAPRAAGPSFPPSSDRDVSEDACDGPVDLWVDDVDGDWDDTVLDDIVPETAPEITSEAVPETVSERVPERLVAERLVVTPPEEFARLQVNREQVNREQVNREQVVPDQVVSE